MKNPIELLQFRLDEMHAEYLRILDIPTASNSDAIKDENASTLFKIKEMIDKYEFAIKLLNT